MPEQQPENPDKGEQGQNSNEQIAQPIQAELVEPSIADAAVVEPQLTQQQNSPHPSFASAAMAPTAELVMAPPNFRLPPGFENLSATGGAVGALVLGVWAILGSLLTPYAAINSILGFMLGLWGLTSQKKRLALIGIVLCIVGLAMSLLEVSRIISLFFADEPTV